MKLSRAMLLLFPIALMAFWAATAWAEVARIDVTSREDVLQAVS